MGRKRRDKKKLKMSMGAGDALVFLGRGNVSLKVRRGLGIRVIRKLLDGREKPPVSD